MVLVSKKTRVNWFHRIPIAKSTPKPLSPKPTTCVAWFVFWCVVPFGFVHSRTALPLLCCCCYCCCRHVAAGRLGISRALLLRCCCCSCSCRCVAACRLETARPLFLLLSPEVEALPSFTLAEFQIIWWVVWDVVCWLPQRNSAVAVTAALLLQGDFEATTYSFSGTLE